LVIAAISIQSDRATPAVVQQAKAYSLDTPQGQAIHHQMMQMHQMQAQVSSHSNFSKK